MTEDKTALDVWFRFDDEEDDEPTYEANTFKTDDGYVIEWYHNDVGQVTEVEVATYEEAQAWYEQNGYLDFTA
jgi:hypothetical protein